MRRRASSRINPHRFIMTAIAFSFVEQAAIGAGLGVAEFLFCTTCQKTCMLAGIQFEEIMDSDDVHPSERLDKMFSEMTIIYPICEELVFRGLLQPFLTKCLLYSWPQLETPSLFGISQASLISSTAIGTIFGMMHYMNYQKGGEIIVGIGSVSGSFFGITRARFGLTTSISAHMIHNYLMGWLDKHYPAFLDSSVREAP